MPCMENIEAKGVKRERPKCPNCKKVLKYEQNYIENKYVKPLEKTHTIVMAHNLNILHYIYKKFVCKNLASVGYYIGGMSEAELKHSEKKQIVLASYSMSSEGLDIPTLNAEFLITPKTDIVQTVGRILRAKHKFSHPIIYDFVDSHEVFQRQWLKRKAFYKKQNYKIVKTTSVEYTSDYKKWKLETLNKFSKKAEEEEEEEEENEDEIEEKHDIWTKEFTKEMDKRIKRFEEGKDKGKDSEIVVKNLLKLVTSK